MKATECHFELQFHRLNVRHIHVRKTQFNEDGRTEKLVNNSVIKKNNNTRNKQAVIQLELDIVWTSYRYEIIRLNFAVFTYSQSEYMDICTG